MIEPENIKKLKTIVYLLTGILAFELIMLAVMLYPGNTFIWITIAMLFVICLYLSRITVALLKFFEKKGN